MGFLLPDDFFRFRDFLDNLERQEISLATTLGVTPAGIFEFVAGAESATVETRFHRDPPEFLTLLLGDTDGLHWGYYIDDPSAPPYVVANYYHNDAYELSWDADLFEALASHSEDRIEQAEDEEAVAEISRLLELLKPYRPSHAATRRAIAPTRDGMGIVVPPETYVPLASGDPFQEAMYSPTVDEVEDLRAKAMEATRHGFPGTALKLGKDLWDYSEFFNVSCELLTAAYEGLGRPALRRRLDEVREFRRTRP